MWKEIIGIIPCHRIPDRCLKIHGKRMSICSRCFAILAGYAFAPLAILLSLNISFLVWFITSIPMVMDGFTQRWGLRKSNNGLRVITGFLFGIAQSLMVSKLVWWIINSIT